MAGCKLTTEQQQLVSDNYYLIHMVLKRKKLLGDKYKDYEQFLAEALCRTVKYFNPDLGYAFSTFAIKSLEGAYLHYLRDYDWQGMRKSRSAWNQNSKEYSIVNIDKPTEDSISALYEIIEDSSTKYAYHDAVIYMDFQSILKSLPERTQKIIQLKLKNYTQPEIAELVVKSQSTINRDIRNFKHEFLAYINS